MNNWRKVFSWQRQDENKEEIINRFYAIIFEKIRLAGKEIEKEKVVYATNLLLGQVAFLDKDDAASEVILFMNDGFDHAAGYIADMLVQGNI